MRRYKARENREGVGKVAWESNLKGHERQHQNKRGKAKNGMKEGVKKERGKDLGENCQGVEGG